MPGFFISNLSETIDSPTFFDFGYFFTNQSEIVSFSLLPSECTAIPEGLSITKIFGSSYRIFIFMCPWQESNLHQGLRRASFYPLNYKGRVRDAGLEPATFRV